MKYKLLIVSLLVFSPIAFSIKISQNLDSKKISGVNFVSPSIKSSISDFNALKRINAEWIAFNPYAFSKMNEPGVKYSYKGGWWGERLPRVEKMVKKAKKDGFKVVLKPHIWVMGQGWGGEYDLKTEADWLIWEKEYEEYILACVQVAIRNDVEMVCIGTEYKIATAKRKRFWEQLIKSIRKVYNGKIIYAANWDNYKNISFWDQLDYIGIDAYFPLSNKLNADEDRLDVMWKGLSKELNRFSSKHGKKIIFTEYGYKSINRAAWRQWEIENVAHDEQVNLTAQINGYRSLYRNIWNQPWFAGGFLWKWYPDDVNAGGKDNSDYTPQHKPVEKIIRHYYK